VSVATRVVVAVEHRCAAFWVQRVRDRTPKGYSEGQRRDGSRNGYAVSQQCCVRSNRSSSSQSCSSSP
jgi:hypothetical protein